MKAGYSILLAAGLSMLALDAFACGGCGCQAKKDDHKHDHKITKSSEKHYEVVDTKGMKELVESKKKVLVLDARSAKYDDGRRIPGAQHLSASSTEAEIKKALPDKEAKIVAYCTNTKCPASKVLLERLAKLGYNDLTKYPDGIDGWEKSGNKVDKK